jgi:hypothetical protein
MQSKKKTEKVKRKYSLDRMMDDIASEFRLVSDCSRESLQLKQSHRIQKKSNE